MTRDDVWYVPSLNRQKALGHFVRALSVGSGIAVTTLALGIYLDLFRRQQFPHHTQMIIASGLSTVLLAILLALVSLSWPARLLATVVCAAPWVYIAFATLPHSVLGPLGLVGLLLGYPLLLFFSLRSALRLSDLPDAALDWRLRSLATELPGWKAYLPRTPSPAEVRVLISPAGGAFLVGITWAVRSVQHGTEELSWSGMDANTVRKLARQGATLIQGQNVLWVIPPSSAAGEYPPSLDRGVSVVIAETRAFAEQLKAWSAMRARLHQRTSSASEHGRAVEERATAALQAILPADWVLRPNVLLAQGGDADLHLSAPSGEQYVIDIKSRTDQFDPAAPKGDRAVSWQEIHDQIVQAARQLGGVPVVWQPEARDEDTRRVGAVWCQRGDARALMDALLVLDAGHLTAKTMPPHEVLGVPEHATLDEIRAAYREQVKRYHPDRLTSLGSEFQLFAEQRMKAVNAAYQTLLDRQR